LKIMKAIRKQGFRISIIYFFIDDPKIAIERIYYNGFERLVAVASGEKSEYRVFDEALFQLFKKGIKNDK